MNSLDFAIVFLYILALLAIGLFLNSRQKSKEDYFLGGRSIPWWASGISTMASQLSAVSFISAPAFVALKDVNTGGGLRWLSYEFGVPLAMLFIIVFLIPAYHKSGVISIYEFLEERFDRKTRTLVSVFFQISRGLATGVLLHASGLVCAIFFGESDPTQFWPYVLAIGLVTITYGTFGGIRAVVISDTIQMGVLLVGLIVLSVIGLSQLGSTGAVFSAYSGELERLKILEFSFGLETNDNFGFFPMLIGGFFLYVAYYGCDQSQVQRELSVGGVEDIRKSLLLNAFLRFPVTLLYCGMGLIIGAVAIYNTEFLAQIPKDKPDYLVPMFILEYLPHGLKGFIFVAIIAAAMSSLDSALNSMSASSVRDVYQTHFDSNANEEKLLRVSKLFTVAWGLTCTGFAFIVPYISSSIIVAINKVGSILYGPILASFLMAIFLPSLKSLSVRLGIVLGVICNISIWLFFPNISWLWWNPIGTVVAIGLAVLFSSSLSFEISDRSDVSLLIKSLVIAYAALIPLVCYCIQVAIQGG